MPIATALPCAALPRRVSAMLYAPKALRPVAAFADSSDSAGCAHVAGLLVAGAYGRYTRSRFVLENIKTPMRAHLFMPSYVYITSSGTDPGAGSVLDDPLFGPVPTLGACVPNLRRHVTRGDWMFVVSGRRSNLQQYLIGGLRVAEKISAIAAYQRFPEYRMRRQEDGTVVGNVPVNEFGEKHELDGHPNDGFDRRIENYLVGDRAVQLVGDAEIALGRERTLNFLSDLRAKRANRIFDAIGRASRLNDGEVERMLAWFDDVKQVANGQRRE